MEAILMNLDDIKIRGFDIPALYRKDALIRIKYMELDIEERQRRIKELERSIPGKKNDRKE